MKFARLRVNNCILLHILSHFVTLFFHIPTASVKCIKSFVHKFLQNMSVANSFLSFNSERFKATFETSHYRGEMVMVAFGMYAYEIGVIQGPAPQHAEHYLVQLADVGVVTLPGLLLEPLPKVPVPHKRARYKDPTHHNRVAPSPKSIGPESTSNGKLQPKHWRQLTGKHCEIPFIHESAYEINHLATTEGRHDEGRAKASPITSLAESIKRKTIATEGPGTKASKKLQDGRKHSDGESCVRPGPLPAQALIRYTGDDAWMNLDNDMANTGSVETAPVSWYIDRGSTGNSTTEAHIAADHRPQPSVLAPQPTATVGDEHTACSTACSTAADSEISSASSIGSFETPASWRSRTRTNKGKGNGSGKGYSLRSSSVVSPSGTAKAATAEAVVATSAAINTRSSSNSSRHNASSSVEREALLQDFAILSSDVECWDA